MSTPQLKYLPIAQLIESATNYRKTHDPIKHAELVASIRELGILTPLIVRSSIDGRYEVAAGHRRLRAAREAAVTEVPAVVREMTDREFTEVMLAENLQRVDPDPLDEADAYQLMIAELEYDVPTLAAKFGKSETYVRHRLVLTQLSAEARAALDRGVIELGHAVLLARVTADRQDELLRDTLLSPRHLPPARFRPEDPEDALDVGEDYDVAGQEGQRLVLTDPVRTLMSIAELRYAMAETLLPLACVKWDRDDATLLPSAGSCTACPKRTGANPTLFAELDAADDRCPDASCYGAKRTAWLEARVAAVQSQAPATVLISGAHKRKLKTFAGQPVLRSDVEWAKAKSNARGSVPAIIVESDRYALQDQWDDLGKLIDVKLVKPETKAKAPASAQRSSGGSMDWNQRRTMERDANARFFAGVRAVVRALVAAPRVPSRQPLLCAYVLYGADFDHRVSEILRDECGDPTLEQEQIAQLSDETLTDRSLQVAAAVLCLDDLDTPGWYQSAAPTLDEDTKTYPMPIGLTQLAIECGLVSVGTVWAEAIAAHAAEPVAA